MDPRATRVLRGSGVQVQQAAAASTSYTLKKLIERNISAAENVVRACHDDSYQVPQDHAELAANLGLFQGQRADGTAVIHGDVRAIIVALTDLDERGDWDYQIRPLEDILEPVS